jgi:PhnB protein
VRRANGRSELNARTKSGATDIARGGRVGDHPRGAFLPKGATTVSEPKGLIPHLVVNGAAAAIDYYKAALGAEELVRMPAPDGRLMHAALRVGDATLFLCDDFPDHCGGVSRAPNGPSPLTLHLCVPDTDAAVARAAAAGGTVTMPAEDMFWGDRYGLVTDPFGHSWSFSTPLTAERKAVAEKKWAEQGWGAPPESAAA